MYLTTALVFSILSLLTLLSLLPSIHATNSIVFNNRCSHPIYYFEVSTTLPNLNPLGTQIAAKSMHPYHMRNTEALGAGIALKLRDVPEYRVAPAGILQAEYHLEPSTGSVWYDLSFIDCDAAAEPEEPLFCPFKEGGVRMYVPGFEDEGCEQAICGEKEGCSLVYLEPGSWLGEPSLRCTEGVDIHIDLCLDNEGRRTILPAPEDSSSLP